MTMDTWAAWHAFLCLLALDLALLGAVVQLDRRRRDWRDRYYRLRSMTRTKPFREKG